MARIGNRPAFNAAIAFTLAVFYTGSAASDFVKRSELISSCKALSIFQSDIRSSVVCDANLTDRFRPLIERVWSPDMTRVCMLQTVGAASEHLVGYACLYLEAPDTYFNLICLRRSDDIGAKILQDEFNQISSLLDARARDIENCDGRLSYAPATLVPADLLLYFEQDFGLATAASDFEGTPVTYYYGTGKLIGNRLELPRLSGQLEVFATYGGTYQAPSWSRELEVRRQEYEMADGVQITVEWLNDLAAVSQISDLIKSQDPSIEYIDSSLASIYIEGNLNTDVDNLDALINLSSFIASSDVGWITSNVMSSLNFYHAPQGVREEFLKNAQNIPFIDRLNSKDLQFYYGEGVLGCHEGGFVASASVFRDASPRQTPQLTYSLMGINCQSEPVLQEISSRTRQHLSDEYEKFLREVADATD